jgi:hypothetical protein
MTVKRAAVYIGSATLLAAWLSSAASLPLQSGDRNPPPAAAPAAAPTDGLAAEVQAQARRLKERLTASPLPQQPVRNPFAFAPSAPPPSAVRPRQPLPDPLPAIVSAPAEPVLSLIGFAEERRSQGFVRTAMLAAEGDQLIVAAVGDVVLTRYTVTFVGSDAIELADSTSAAVRRIALQQF